MRDLFGRVVPQQLELNFETSQEKEEAVKARSVQKQSRTNVLELSAKTHKRIKLREIFSPLRSY